MATYAAFNNKTTATEVAAAFGAEIKGKNVLITGISPAGVGCTTAVAIASQGPDTLILASRTPSKLEAVTATLKQKFSSVNIKTVALDLATVDSIKAAAAKITSLVDHLDVLINNAGISAQLRDPLPTPDGTIVDLQFFTNHLGPFLLTSLLLPKLQAAAGSGDPAKGAVRIINLSSHGHRLSPIRFSDYSFSKPMYDGVPEDEQPSRKVTNPMVLNTIDGYPGFMGYGQSKTANILHATELSRRLRGSGVVALSVHPGTIETELSRGLDDEGRNFINKTAPAGIWKTQDEGAATTLVAAFDPKLGELVTRDEAGIGYLADCQLAEKLAAPHATNVASAKRLWEETERMLGISSGPKL